MSFLDFYPLIILLAINLSLIFRRIGSLEVPVWISFLIGAILIILRSQSDFDNAVLAVSTQADVFLFLFGMFIIITALEISGALDDFANYLLKRASDDNTLLIFCIFGFGLASSILLNDTIAIVAPVILIQFGKKIKTDIKPFILVIAISISFGSALAPTGNPQNFLLTISGSVTFVKFVLIAIIPTSLALLTTAIYLKHIHKNHFSSLPYPEFELLTDKNDYQDLKKTAILVLSLIVPFMAISPYIGISMGIPALIGGSILLIITKERNIIIEKIDWTIMILFSGMFVVIDSVVRIPYFEKRLADFANIEFTLQHFIVLLAIAFFLSQLISNVPVAILISRVIVDTTFDQPLVWVLVAITITFAGATSMMGAASNFIVVETAKKRGVHISWIEFTRIGFPLSLICFSEVIIFASICTVIL